MAKYNLLTYLVLNLFCEWDVCIFVTSDMATFKWVPGRLNGI